MEKKITISVFGAIFGVAGIEHGIGEILQGTAVPGSLLIQSWPDNPFYEILSGEPAFTILPGTPVYITGILAVTFSVMLVVWSLFFISKKYSGLIFLALSAFLFLFGGGIAGPLLIGLFLAWAISRMHKGVKWIVKYNRLRYVLIPLWKFVFPVSVLCWLMLWPGMVLLGKQGVFPAPSFVYTLTLISLMTMYLSVFSAMAIDHTERKKTE